MRVTTLAGSGLLTLATAVAPLHAEDMRVASGPDTKPCPTALAAIATCYSAKLESGAYLLAAMPRNWNGNLVVFAHGALDSRTARYIPRSHGPTLGRQQASCVAIRSAMTPRHDTAL